MTKINKESSYCLSNKDVTVLKSYEQINLIDTESDLADIKIEIK